MVAASGNRGGQQEAAARAAARQAQERTVRAKVACDKAAFQTQWKLIEETVSSPTLEAAAQLLQPHHYDDVVEERALDRRCGYPCCGNPVPEGKQGPQFHISVSERKVYEVDGLYRFCSVECAQQSCVYRSRIPPTSLFLRGGLDAAADALSTLQIDAAPKLKGAKSQGAEHGAGADAKGNAGSSRDRQARDHVSTASATAPCAQPTPGRTSAGNSRGASRGVRGGAEGDAPRAVQHLSQGAAGSIPNGFLAGRVVERGPDPKPP